MCADAASGEHMPGSETVPTALHMEDGLRLLELAREASRLFAKQAPNEKKRLLNLVLSNCEWDRGEVRANFRQPFDLLAESAAAAASSDASGTKLSTGHPVWLGNLDSNQD
ncbi:hypothetical protein NKH73_15600 [Mesorhizobium sp. M0938]|uniref:hypothetical protein n=1 Tax=unclassified Mesorhizobium TaxID=325217 RepID=UPI003338BCCD